MQEKNPTHAGFTWIHLDKEKECHTCTLGSVWMPSASTLISGATETPHQNRKKIRSKHSAIYKTKILATAPEKKSKHSAIYKT